MTKIIQYHASVIDADAIGNSIRMLDRRLTDLGADSYVCCADREIGKAAAGVLPASAILNAAMGRSLSEDDVLLLHYSFYDETIERLASMPLRRILIYHNVTPGEYFAEVGLDWLANICHAARQQLGRLSGLVDAAVGDSDFNSLELKSTGFKSVDTIPILLDLERFIHAEIDIEAFHRLKGGADINLLFVGRFVPNKRIERVFSAAAHFRNSFPLSINIHVVGKIWDASYFSALVDYASRAQIADCLRFHIHVDELQLRTLYAAADAFICMSDHEGFMVPIVEAFASGCPVIALNAGAVGETMGGAGLLIGAPDPELVAGLVYALKTDKQLKLRVVAGQGRRLSAFHPERAVRLWVDKIRSVSPAFQGRAGTQSKVSEATR